MQGWTQQLNLQQRATGAESPVPLGGMVCSGPSRPGEGGEGEDFANHVDVAVGGRQEVFEHGHGVGEVVQDPAHFPREARGHVLLSTLLLAALQCPF